MKRWYRSSLCKGLLILLAHMLAVGTVIASFWLIVTSGMQALNPFARAPQSYEETSAFEQQMRSTAKQAMEYVKAAEIFELNGSYDENKLIDITAYIDEDIDVLRKGINEYGVAYSLGDLKAWSEAYLKEVHKEQYSGSDDKDGESIIVCRKPDDTYYYYYASEFEQKILNGELKFQDGLTGNEVQKALDHLIVYNLSSNREIVDANGQTMYTSYWNMAASTTIIKERYFPVDSQGNLISLVEIGNTDERWNGRISELMDKLDKTLRIFDVDLEDYMSGYSLAEGDTNFSYMLVDHDNKRVYTNKEEYRSYENVVRSMEDIKRLGSYVEVGPKLSQYGSFGIEIDSSDLKEWRSLVKEASLGENINYQFIVAMDDAYRLEDEFAVSKETYERTAPYIHAVSISVWVMVCSIFIILIWLTAVTGRSPKSDQVVLSWFDCWKTEISIGIVIVAGIGSIAFFERALEQFSSSFSWYYLLAGQSEKNVSYLYSMSVAACVTLVVTLVFFVSYLSLIRRVKAHTLWSNSLLKMFVDGCVIFWNHKKTVFHAVVIFVCSVMLHFLMIGSGSKEMCMFIIILDAIILLGLIRYAVAREKIQKGIREIASGNINYQIDNSGMKGQLYRIAEDLNKISDGLNRAVEKNIKDERLKTDLITNVSHDIKTPLTSIINYVDLLKRENFTDPKIRNYLDILEAKSQRLKILTEDVVEASKVSSGNIKLEFMTLNMVELVNQTSGEFSEKFEARNLTVIMNFPEEPALIRVDGRRMWRVFSNVFNNAAKYAMAGTRVYADITMTEDEVIFSLKNISEQALNISADELTERFIRGDVSRSTEGSGLGLSIARNLTELQGGTLKLYLDGDLFKVTIIFPREKLQTVQEKEDMEASS